MTSFHYCDRDSIITLDDGTKIDLLDPRAFSIISEAWLRAGWDTKYVYSFSWMGRPIIQLPEDILRIQEVIYGIKPDVIIETGIAHGGSLIFYASLCTAIGKGRVIGIDIEIRPHNRKGIEEHKLSPLISLIQGNSTDIQIIEAVKSQICSTDTVLVILDSSHLKDHVLAELRAYSPLVSPGSYIIACDGIMKQIVGAPRTQKDWSWNNPISAIDEFLETSLDFEYSEPVWLFNEGIVTERVTYWPKAYLRKKINDNI